MAQKRLPYTFVCRQCDSSHVEEWRDVPNYEGFYSVSSKGRIRREKTIKSTFAGRILKGGISATYNSYQLCNGNDVTQILGHRILMAAFVGQCPEGYEVNHKDTDRSHNHLDNLEYVTRQENSKHTWLYGKGRRGEECYQSKLTEQDVLTIRERFANGTLQRILAADFGIHVSMVSLITRRKKWQHI